MFVLLTTQRLLVAGLDTPTHLCTVTIDALGCQTTIVDAIVAQEGDYLLQLKENQGNLYEDVELRFEDLEASRYRAYPYATSKTVDKNHGRIEIRQAWTISDPQVIAGLRNSQRFAGLNFAAFEKVTRRAMTAAPQTNIFLFDFQRVGRVEQGVLWMVADLVCGLAQQGKQVGLVQTQQCPEIPAAVYRVDGALGVHEFPDLDAALEWSEEMLLTQSATNVRRDTGVPLAEHQACANLSADDLAVLADHLTHQVWEAGEVVVQRGDPADALYLITRGQLSVTVDLPGGQRRRLSALAAGMMFGELALIQRGVRSADVRADTYTQCYVLRYSDFDALATVRPTLRMALLENLLTATAQTVFRLSEEVTVLAAA
jgi:CRP-like cAMP-binding protein/predicted transposase YbfD/YdcC